MIQLIGAIVAGQEEELMGLVIFSFHASDQLMVVMSAVYFANKRTRGL